MRSRSCTNLLLKMLLAVMLALCSVDLSAATIEIEVSSVADSGDGSLRAALELAAAMPDLPVRIHFGPSDGLFSTPQLIELASPLPAVRGEVTIDGFLRNVLWRAYGATISGADRHRIFKVTETGNLRLSGITLQHGHSDTGGAILNRGRLELEGVSLLNNGAEGNGGAIANQGELWIINSTLAWNRSRCGGGLAHLTGQARLINVTLFRNSAETAASVFSTGHLHIANSLLAGDPELSHCINTGSLSTGTTHNLIQGAHEGCGEPVLTVDPGIEDRLGYYNGPTPTLPIGGASPVVNLGLNEAAVNARGQLLRWDQRGNGDPRFAGGFTDLGAFERQGHLPTEFLVDIMEDNGLRACSMIAPADCPLRAAIELASKARSMTPILFHSAIFDTPQVLVLPELPQTGNTAILLDGEGTAGITIFVPRPVSWLTQGPVQIKIGHGTGSNDNERDH